MRPASRSRWRRSGSSLPRSEHISGSTPRRSCISARKTRGGDRPMAQLSKRIERLAPELDKIVETSQPINDLADGFGGALGPAEGPLWWKEGRYLVFSDIHNSRRHTYVPGRGVSLLLEPTNRANGLTRDLQGRLI